MRKGINDARSASGHILSSFEDAIGALRTSALSMSRLTEQSLDRAINGLFNRDDDLCARVIADEEEIDRLEREIDKGGIDLLVRFHPTASDLRRVVATMKFGSSLKRMADQAIKIARKARKLNRSPQLPEVHLIESMRSHVMAMLRDSMDCFAREDVEVALALKSRDRTLDQINAFIGDQLSERMAQEPEQVRGYLNLMFIARHLERVGDHATNIAEDAVYAAVAEDIRHRPK